MDTIEEQIQVMKSPLSEKRSAGMSADDARLGSLHNLIREKDKEI
jgi:hypothetical protein